MSNAIFLKPSNDNENNNAKFLLRVMIMIMIMHGYVYAVMSNEKIMHHARCCFNAK